MNQVSFPVYRLPTKPSIDDGIIFYATESKTGKYSISIIDDLNQKGKTLSQRRIQLLGTDAVLYNFKASVYFIADLVKLSTGTTYWIDSAGKLFKHLKTNNYKLVYKKIKKIIRQPGHLIIEVEGISSRFKCLYPPLTSAHTYASLLTNTHEYIFYGFTESEGIGRRRKV